MRRYRLGAHTKTDLKIHIIWSPKYRKKVLSGQVAIPSKLFECMGMGLPVLHGVAGESAEIVVQENAGVVFEPENSDDLIEKLLELKNNPEK